MNDAANLHLKAADETKGPTRELRIAVTVPIPLEAFAQAEALIAAKPLLMHIQAETSKLGGTVLHEVVTPKPRGAAAD